MMVTTNQWWIAEGSCRKRRVNPESKAVEEGSQDPDVLLLDRSLK